MPKKAPKDKGKGVKAISSTEELERQALLQRVETEKNEIENIDYNKFPTVLGMYFDGLFVQNYSLNDEYAEYFLEIEEEREAIRDFELAETFTEMASRNFWPPKYHGGFFRTRGVYLDLHELKEDPPKTPPEMNFEKQKGLIGSNDDDDDNDNSNLAEKMNTWAASGDTDKDDDTKGNIKDNWYWDDEKDEFLPKVPEDEYYFDDAEKVFKQKLNSDSSPYDWFFDDNAGKFYRRDRARLPDYNFDHNNNVFKKKGKKGPSVNGLTPSDYLFDENDQRWHRRNYEDERGVVFYPQGHRKIKKGPRGRSQKTADDYYYDPNIGKMTSKDATNEKLYKFDPKDEMWKKNGDPYHTNNAVYYPQDFCFDKADGVWKPKVQVELKKVSPYDFYFDDDVGRYFPRDKNQRELYEFDHKLNIWKLKGATGPSANQLSNLDYYFDENAFAWKLNISIPNQDNLSPHQAGKRKVLVGDRGKSGKTDDDYYYDSTEGKFLPKTDKLSNYYYDTEAEIFRKIGQPLSAKGADKRNYKDYYFDPHDGLWLPTGSALVTPKTEQKLRARPELNAYDFAFNDATGLFELRNLNTPENYTYKPETAVYHKNGPKGPSSNGKIPAAYYFDEVDGQWHPKNSEKGGEAHTYPNGRRRNRLGPRGLSGLIPDDMYFDTADGKFRVKDKGNPELYEYDPKEGVWKLKGCPPGPGKHNNLFSVDYYWDDELGEFLEKRKLTSGELCKDRNTNVWKIRRRKPKDFYWDMYPGKYQRKQGRYVIGDDGKKTVDKTKVLKEAKNKAQVLDEKDDEDDDSDDDDLEPDRNDEYNKPWLHNFPHLAADKFRLDTETKRIEELQQKKLEATQKKEKEAAEKKAREAAEMKAKAKAAKEARRMQKQMGSQSPSPSASNTSSKPAQSKPKK